MASLRKTLPELEHYENDGSNEPKTASIEIDNEAIILFYNQKNTEEIKENSIQKLEVEGTGISPVFAYGDFENGELYAVKQIQIKSFKSKKETKDDPMEKVNIEIDNNVNIVNKLFKSPERFVDLKHHKLIQKPNHYEMYLFMERCDGSLQDYINELLNYENNKKKLDEIDLKHIFDSIIPIIKTLIETIKIIKAYDYIHSDLKPKNILWKCSSGNNNIQIKLADFYTLISYKEYKETSCLRGLTENYSPFDKETSLKYIDKDTCKENKFLSENEFYGIDVHGFCKTVLEFLSVCRKLNFSISEKDKIIDLETLFTKMKTNYKNTSINNIDAEINEIHKNDETNKNPICIPIKIIREIISKKMLNNKKLIRKYISLGYYSKPLYFLHYLNEDDKVEKDDILELANIYDSIGNSKLSLYYLEQFEKKLNTNESNYLINICSCDALKGNCYDRLAQKENSKVLIPKILKNIEKVSLNLRDFKTQLMLVNFLFLLNENDNKDDANKLIKRIDSIIKKENIAPRMNKKITEEDVDNLNYFLYRFFNQKSIHLKYTKGSDMKQNYQIMKDVLAIQKTLVCEYSLGRSEIYNNFGNAAELIENFQEASEYYSKSYKIRKTVFENQKGEISEKKLIIPLYNQMRMLLKSTKYEDHQEANKIGKEILEKRINLSGNKDNMDLDIEVLQARRLVGESAFLIKNYKEAKEMYIENRNCYQNEKMRNVLEIKLINDWIAKYSERLKIIEEILSKKQ